jgi:hypothetical protein
MHHRAVDDFRARLRDRLDQQLAPSSLPLDPDVSWKLRQWQEDDQLPS